MLFVSTIHGSVAIVSIVILMVSGRSHQGHCRILRYIRLMSTDGREVVLWSVRRALCRWWRLVAGGRSSSFWRHSATITLLLLYFKSPFCCSRSSCSRIDIAVPPPRHSRTTAAPLPCHRSATATCCSAPHPRSCCLLGIVTVNGCTNIAGTTVACSLPASSDDDASSRCFVFFCFHAAWCAT